MELLRSLSSGIRLYLLNHRLWHYFCLTPPDNFHREPRSLDFVRVDWPTPGGESCSQAGRAARESRSALYRHCSDARARRAVIGMWLSLELETMAPRRAGGKGTRQVHHVVVSSRFMRHRSAMDAPLRRAVRRAVKSYSAPMGDRPAPGASRRPQPRQAPARQPAGCTPRVAALPGTRGPLVGRSGSPRRARRGGYSRSLLRQPCRGRPATPPAAHSRHQARPGRCSAPASRPGLRPCPGRCASAAGGGHAPGASPHTHPPAEPEPASPRGSAQHRGGRSAAAVQR